MWQEGHTAHATAEESEKEREVRKKEKELQEIISQMAKMIIDENEELVGTETAERAKNKIDEESKKNERKGGKVDEEKQKTTTRRRKKQVS